MTPSPTEWVLKSRYFWGLECAVWMWQNTKHAKTVLTINPMWPLSPFGPLAPFFPRSPQGPSRPDKPKGPTTPCIQKPQSDQKTTHIEPTESSSLSESLSIIYWPSPLWVQDLQFHQDAQHHPAEEEWTWVWSWANVLCTWDQQFVVNILIYLSVRVRWQDWKWSCIWSILFLFRVSFW